MIIPIISIDLRIFEKVINQLLVLLLSFFNKFSMYLLFLEKLFQMKSKAIIFIFFFTTILFTYAQSKKKHLTDMKYEIDSLIMTINNERNERTKLMFDIEVKNKEIENLTQTNKNIQEKLNSLIVESLDLKKKLNILSNNQQSSTSDLPFFTIYIDNYKADFVSSTIKPLFKFPERSSLPENQQYSKSTSELKELHIWEKDNVAYAFVLILDKELVPNPSPFAGQGDSGELGEQITFSCYLLKKVESDFVVIEKWNSPIETCFLTLETNFIGKNIDFHLTDIDKDNNFEIWYVIESLCSFGIEPSKLEVNLFNKGKINKMESVTNSRDFFTDTEIKEWIQNGSNYVINKFDSNFENLSDNFKSYAIELRNNNIYGLKNY